MANCNARQKRLVERPRNICKAFNALREARRKRAIKHRSRENVFSESPKLNFIPSNSISTLSIDANRNQTLSLACTISRKGGLRDWAGGLVFDMELKDDTGRIKATAWNQIARELYPNIVLGARYFIERPYVGLIKNHERKYYPHGHVIKITLIKETKIIEIREDAINDQKKWYPEYNENSFCRIEKSSCAFIAESAVQIKNCFVKISRLNGTATKAVHKKDTVISDITKFIYENDESFETSVKANHKWLDSLDKKDNLTSRENFWDNNNDRSYETSSRFWKDKIISETSTESESSNSDDVSYSSRSEDVDDFIDDSQTSKTPKFRAILDYQIKDLSRKTRNDIANTKKYRKNCLEPQLGTSDKIRKIPTQISKRLRKALMARASGKHSSMKNVIREFKFLYTTNDYTKLSECICGAPGALRLHEVHWYVNSTIYKTERSQEKNKFKVGNNCAQMINYHS